MKNKIKTIIIIMLISLTFTSLLLLNRNAYSNTQVISIGGTLFTPNSVTASVGDTIKWVWANGIHTTTSTVIPAGAIPWNSSMDSAHTTFTYVISIPGQYNYQCSFHYLFGMTGVINVNPTAIKPLSNKVPEEFKLYQNYPNPFNPTTNIKFDLAKNVVVKISIYAITGELVETLVKQELQSGTYSVEWDASKYSSGIYLYQLEMPGFSQTKKLMLVK